MNSILLWVVVLAAVGGLIAYIGDRLGTYVGKKRMSVIGLRPRHTAMLYTVVSGGAIASLTLLFLVSFDRAFQHALLEGPRIIYQNRRLTRENALRTRQFEDETAKARAAQAKAQTATDQLAQVQRQLRPVRLNLAQAQTALGRSQQSLQVRQAQLGQAQAQLADARGSLSRTDAQLATSRVQIRQARSALSSAQASVRLAQQDIRREQRRVSDLTGEGLRLAAQNETLRTQRQRLFQRAAASLQPLIYRSGQEIDRTVIPTTRPVTEIEGRLNVFLNDLGAKVVDRGGNHGDNGRAVAVAVPNARGDEYRTLRAEPEREAIRALAQNIASGADGVSSVVVVARAAHNTFKGEQAGVDLRPYDNVLIYPKGAVVATGTIRETQSAPQALDGLNRFLTETVRPAVSHQGLIPRPDPQTGQPLFGAPLDEATISALVQQIQQLGSDASVTAYASQDTYSTGPLLLRLSVTPVPSIALPGRPSADTVHRS